MRNNSSIETLNLFNFHSSTNCIGVSADDNLCCKRKNEVFAKTWEKVILCIEKMDCNLIQIIC